jgi:hypothetical protein
MLRAVDEAVRESTAFLASHLAVPVASTVKGTDGLSEAHLRRHLMEVPVIITEYRQDAIQNNMNRRN